MSDKFKIHPEVEKFYTDGGYVVDTDFPLFPVGSDWRLYWCIIKDGVQIKYIGFSDLMHGWGDHSVEFPNPIKCTNYIWNKKEYSEQEMLRIIKLKAFL